MPASSKLADYNAKRDFSKTREPRGQSARKSGRAFVVQKHDASRTHFDFRLEHNGVLLSWAVTRGPSADPSEKRLAVRTEDHPLDYRTFEGTIPKGEYGGGTVMLWDRGRWSPTGDVDQGLTDGKLTFKLDGKRMHGGWALVRMRRKSGEKRENWLLIKERDDDAEDTPNRLTNDHRSSIATGRTMSEIASNGAPHDGTENKPKSRAATQQRGRKGANPRFRKPQLATLVSDAPDGDDWLHETKFDGYRCLVSIGKNGVKFYTRNGNDWTDKFASLAASVAGLDCDAALLDGEVVARHAKGASAFSALQKALSQGEALQIQLFDALSIDGTDLTKDPLRHRKQRLRRLFEPLPDDSPVRYSSHIEGRGPTVLDNICKRGGEGIISKKASAPYRGDRNRNWLKIKCTRRQEFVVGGWSPSDKRERPFSSLLLGQYADGLFVYRGRVGSGFTEDDLDQIADRLERLSRKTAPFDDVPSDIARDAEWVTPKLVAEIDFAELTHDGHLRHAVFLGLRADKDSKAVTTETAVELSAMDEDENKSEAAHELTVLGIRISNADREVFPKAGCRKGDVASYYAMVGERMMNAVAHRPLSLLRCPKGIDDACFFQKHAGKGFPSEVRRIPIEEKDGDTEDYLYVTAPDGLVAAAQMGTIEFHIWAARTDKLEKPDRMVFDLDPDERLAFTDVAEAAADLRQMLDDLDIASVPMVTGGKGVHVVVPLRRTVSWETLKNLSQLVATILAEREPKRFTATMSKAKRKGRIFIDWLRNERGATAIAPYALRARPGAPVAIPVTWDELRHLDRANGFTIADAIERLDHPCPLLDSDIGLQTITNRTRDALKDMIA